MFPLGPEVQRAGIGTRDNLRDPEESILVDRDHLGPLEARGFRAKGERMRFPVSFGVVDDTLSCEGGYGKREGT